MKFDVYLDWRPVGTLLSERGRLRFTYLSDVIEEDGPALSVRLPPRTEPYTHGAVHSYFANLLPEDEYGRLVARTLGVSERNVAGMLGAIGGECAGAVSIWPEGEAPSLKPDYQPVPEEALDRLLDAADASERMAVVRDNRLSLAGGMEKLALLERKGTWWRGMAGAPTNRILKWPQPQFPDQNYNELFCLELWREVGLPVPLARVLGRTTAVLVVERYDRLAHTGDQSPRQIHQEDFCQALGLDSTRKYQGGGDRGPGLANSAEVIRAHCSGPARGLLLLVRWALANFLTGNGDGHGKNLSLLHAPDGIRLAPFYDVASTLAYSGLSRKLAMAVGGEYRFAYVRARHWERLADELDIAPTAVRQDAELLADEFERAMEPVHASLAGRYGDQPMFAKVADIVTEQIALLRANLPATSRTRKGRHTDA